MKILELFEAAGPAGWKKNYEARIDIEPSYSRQMKNWMALDTDKKKAAYKVAKEKFAELQKAHPTGLLFKTVDEAKEYLKTMDYPNWPMFVQNTKGKNVKYRDDKVVVDDIKDKTANDIEITDIPAEMKIKGVEVTIPGVSTGPLISFMRTVMYKAMEGKKKVYNKLGRPINTDKWGQVDFKSNAVLIACTKEEAEKFVEQAKEAEAEHKNYKAERKKADEEYAIKLKKDKEIAAAAKKQRHADLSEKYGKKIANMVVLVEDKKEWKPNKWSIELNHRNITRTTVAQKLTIEQAHKKQEDLMSKLQKGYNPTKPALKWCVEHMHDPSPIQILDLKLVDGKIYTTKVLKFEEGNETKLPYQVGNIDAFMLAGFPNLDSFENFPEETKKLIWYAMPKLTSLKDIHKHVKRCEKIDIQAARDADVKSNILGLLMIEGLQKLDYSGSDHKAKEAFQIIGKYLGQGKQGILKAQQELIDADLDDYAEV